MEQTQPENKVVKKIFIMFLGETRVACENNLNRRINTKINSLRIQFWKRNKKKICVEAGTQIIFPEFGDAYLIFYFKRVFIRCYNGIIAPNRVIYANDRYQISLWLYVYFYTLMSYFFWIHSLECYLLYIHYVSFIVLYTIYIQIYI